MFSVFQALGLKVGIHPIINNGRGNLGGLSAAELMRGPTVAREGDFVENCLAENEMDCDKEDRHSSDSEQEDYEQDEDNDTIVGTKLHKTTITSDYLEEGVSLCIHNPLVTMTC